MGVRVSVGIFVVCFSLDLREFHLQTSAGHKAVVMLVTFGRYIYTDGGVVHDGYIRANLSLSRSLAFLR